MKKTLLGLVVIAALLTLPYSVSAVTDEDVLAVMAHVNARLLDQGLNIQIDKAEILMGNDEVGRTVYFDNRSKQLGHHWVPADPRRGGHTDITWLSDQVDGQATGVTAAQTQAAIDSAMNTWENIQCSDIPLTKLPDYGIDWGYLQYYYYTGGFPVYWYADIVNAGFLPGDFFDILLGPGASNSVLGVTFTFTWSDENGNATDIDNNGKRDTAFREIYYNNKFTWAVDGVNHIDVESVVLHENGHGLSQGHFGAAFRTGNGKLHFAPRAVMNAGYTGVSRGITATDNGGHCSVWGSWPNN